jgi:hypothetical protein
VGSALHLASRFCGSLRPGGPGAAKCGWVSEVLTEPELTLWNRMNGPDRRHSVRVAAAVERQLGADTPREVLAAALLHDVGKIHCGLRTFGRVVATLTIRIVGATEVRSWSQLGGIHRKIALYQDHPRIGGDDLALAGSHDLTIAWTREHHQPSESWTVSKRYADALDACDND